MSLKLISLYASAVRDKKSLRIFYIVERIPLCVEGLVQWKRISSVSL